MLASYPNGYLVRSPIFARNEGMTTPNKEEVRSGRKRSSVPRNKPTKPGESEKGLSQGTSSSDPNQVEGAFKAHDTLADRNK
jgi:hypothetical protein